jgi:hypothetical protein
MPCVLTGPLRSLSRMVVMRSIPALWGGVDGMDLDRHGRTRGGGRYDALPS